MRIRRVLHISALTTRQPARKIKFLRLSRLPRPRPQQVCLTLERASELPRLFRRTGVKNGFERRRQWHHRVPTSLQPHNDGSASAKTAGLPSRGWLTPARVRIHRFHAAEKPVFADYRRVFCEVDPFLTDGRIARPLRAALPFPPASRIRKHCHRSSVDLFRAKRPGFCSRPSVRGLDRVSRSLNYAEHIYNHGSETAVTFVHGFFD